MHHKSNDYKLSAVNYYLVEDKSQEEVCKIFQSSRRSLMRWVQQYKNNGNVERQNRPPVAYKIKKEHIQFINPYSFQPTDPSVNKNQNIN